MTEVLKSGRPQAGVSSLVFTDSDYRRSHIIQTTQDVRPILEANKQAQSGFDRRHDQNPIGARKIASIPLVIVLELARRGIIRFGRAGSYRVLDERAFLRFLSEPEHRWLRTDNGARLA